MNILVVGGAGYIGSHAVRLLMESGHEVSVYDNLSRGHRAAVPQGLLIEGELADRPKLVSTLLDKKIDAVMHFAAFALVNESVNDPALYYRNNVIAALELLDAMRQAGVNQIVFSSTTATYGEPEVVPIPESTLQRPINPYGFTKLVVEQALADYARAYGMAYASLRYFNAAGARPDGTIGEDHDPETHLIPIVLQVALGQRDHITIYGDDYDTPDGTCVRDYIHVDDLGDAHLRALERLEPAQGLCLNLGTGRGTSVREIVEACREVTGHPIPEVVGPRRAGDPSKLVADANLAHQLLRWNPRYRDAKSIIETAWRWHKSHPQGYASTR
jgi:UDP-glucose 4-epimerase